MLASPGHSFAGEEVVSRWGNIDGAGVLRLADGLRLRGMVRGGE